MSNNPNTLRERARRTFWSNKKKREYRCPDCGRAKEQLLTRFEVHHKDGDKKNNNRSNLIALCQPCHNIREGKKPSMKKIRHMRDQAVPDGTVSAPDDVPVCDGGDMYDEYIRRFYESQRPALLVVREKGDGWARVECDLESLDGALLSTAGKGPEPLQVALTNDAARALNHITAKYEMVDFKRGRPKTSLSTLEYGNVSFLNYPAMEEKHAIRLASEIKPIVESPNSWRAPFADDRADVRVADLDWLPSAFVGERGW